MSWPDEPAEPAAGEDSESGRATKGNKPLTSIMVQAAWPAVRTKNTFLKSRYHRLAARRGKKRAIVAVAHYRTSACHRSRISFYF